MKIAVSASQPSLDAPVDPRFGRCAYFILVDPDTWEFEAVENPAVMAAGGAGIQAGQLVAGKGAQVILTGNVGPNAYQTLSAAGLAVITGVTGTVREAVERYRSGQLQSVAGPTVAAHAGVGNVPPAGTPPAGGAGMGRGMGMGRGGGRGWGRGRGRRNAAAAGKPGKEGFLNAE